MEPSQKERRRSSLFGPDGSLLTNAVLERKGNERNQRQKATTASGIKEKRMKRERRKCREAQPTPTKMEMSPPDQPEPAEDRDREDSETVRARTKKVKRKKSICFPNKSRITFSFEHVANLRPILKRHSKLIRAVRRRGKRVVFEKRSPRVKSITPLDDKPRGRVRMPSDSFSAEDEDESEDRTPVGHSRTSDYASTLQRIEADEEESSNAAVTEPSKDRHRLPSVTPPVPLNFDSSFESTQPRQAHPRRTSTSLNWSIADTEITERAVAIRKDRARRKNELWAELIKPQKPEDFVANTPNVRALTRWFESWGKFIDQENGGALAVSGSYVNVGRRGRNIARHEADVPRTQTPPPPTPLIVHGLSGTGKTSAINYAAGANNVALVHRSFAHPLGAELLHSCLARAEEIREKIKAVTSNTKRRGLRSATRALSSLGPKFGVVVIDDCDFIPADNQFWPALKDACCERRAPIIMTCTNYARVRRIVLAEPSPLTSYSTLSFVTPPHGRLINYLRAWFYGFTEELVGAKWLAQMIRECKCRFPAVVNMLQYYLTKAYCADYAPTRMLTDDTSLPMGKHAALVAVMAKFDATFGRAVASTVSWQLAQGPSADDSSPALPPPSRHATREEEDHEMFGQVNELCNEAIRGYTQLSTLPSLRGPSESEKPVKRAVKDACSRSLPSRIYSVRETVLDYLPALLAIDQSFREHQCARWRCGKRREAETAVHPFDKVDPSTDVAIDYSGRLQQAIADYAFPAQRRPTKALF